MKHTKLILIFSVLSFFYSCSNSTSHKNPVKKQILQTPLVTFLLKFYKSNPNSTNNQITIRETSKKFKSELIDFVSQNDSVFYYNPLEFDRSFSDGEKIYGKFSSWSNEIIEDTTESPYRKKWYVDVIMDIPKSQIDTLIEKKKYKVIGKLKRYINENDSEFNTYSYTFEPEISRDFLINEIINFKIGCIYLKNIKIESEN